MYSKSLERVGGISYCDISMVNIILLFNVIEYVNSRFYFFIFIEGFFFVIRGDFYFLIINGMLKLVVWKILGEIKKCMGY